MDVLVGQKDPEPAWGREGEILSEEAEASSSRKGHHGNMTQSTKKITKITKKRKTFAAGMFS